MSMSINERLESLQEAVKGTQRVREKYPEAQFVREGDQAFFLDAGAQPNRLLDLRTSDGAQVIAVEEVTKDAPFVRRTLWHSMPVWSVLERLREKHPEAYADLIQWIGGGR